MELPTYELTDEERRLTTQDQNDLRDALYLYDVGSEKYDASKNICQRLVGDGGVPQYVRMQALIVLFNISGDWQERESLRLKAEAVYNHLTAIYPRGKYERMDAWLIPVMDDLKVMAEKQAEDAVELGEGSEEERGEEGGVEGVEGVEEPEEDEEEEEPKGVLHTLKKTAPPLTDDWMKTSDLPPWELTSSDKEAEREADLEQDEELHLQDERRRRIKKDTEDRLLQKGLIRIDECLPDA
jgi:hypothetical protein